MRFCKAYRNHATNSLRKDHRVLLRHAMIDDSRAGKLACFGWGWVALQKLKILFQYSLYDRTGIVSFNTRWANE
jgi:hypothetical protein